MTDKQLRQAAEYLLTALAVGGVMAATVLLEQLQSGAERINWTPVLVAFLGPIVASGRAAFVDKIGGKPKPRSVKALADEVTALSPAKRKQLAAEVEARAPQELPPVPRYPKDRTVVDAKHLGMPDDTAPTS